MKLLQMINQALLEYHELVDSKADKLTIALNIAKNLLKITGYIAFQYILQLIKTYGFKELGKLLKHFF